MSLFFTYSNTKYKTIPVGHIRSSSVDVMTVLLWPPFTDSKKSVMRAAWQYETTPVISHTFTYKGHDGVTCHTTSLLLYQVVDLMKF